MWSTEERWDVLQRISPTKKSAIQNTDLILQILDAELEERKISDVHEYYENIYWAILLLFLTENVRHVATIWKVKHIDFDLGCGLDGQYLVGAGIDETIVYCRENNLMDAAAYIQRMKDDGDTEERQAWKSDKILYFYGTESS
jgi:hypothetical protein